MIIGGGTEQVPAYETAKQRGLTIVGTDIRSDAPGLALADHVLRVSTRDAEATVAEALAFARRHPVHGIITIANDVPYTVARVAEALGLASISVTAATYASDKLLMKQCFQANGVACPWFSAVDNVGQLKELIQDRDQQIYVLKPIDGRGARGVLRIDASVDLDWAFEASQRAGTAGRLLIEKFVPGVQLSTESFILGDRCYTPAIAERNYARLDQFKPYIIEDGGTIPAPLSAEQSAAVDNVILRGARAMGIDEGIVKGDLVLDAAGHPLIIELAPRLSGGWFATHQIPQASGVDLVDAVISYALGDEVTAEYLTPQWRRATAIRYWFPPEGVIHAMSGEPTLKAVPGLVKYGFFRGVGDTQPRVTSHPDRFGYVIVKGADREEALNRVEQALACLTIEVD